ncbi:hypothetical protein ACFLU6_07560, partial [Acidobacteriota bacterium]
VTPRDPRRRAGIVSFAPPEPAKTAERLQANGIVVALRAGMIRVSPHFYNNEQDINTLLKAL